MMLYVILGDFSRDDELSSESISETSKQKAKATTAPRAEETKIAKQSKITDESGDTSDELSLSLDEMSDEGENIPLTGRRVDTASKHDKQRDSNTELSSRKWIQFEETEDSSNVVFAPVSKHGTAADQVVNDSDAQKPSTAVQNIADKLSVFIAKYTYDPFEHSPNDNPSLELALEAGDYVYVFGDADEVYSTVSCIYRSLYFPFLNSCGVCKNLAYAFSSTQALKSWVKLMHYGFSVRSFRMDFTLGN